jgi:ligand-binding SRPBCC domain-containing protein
MIRIELTTVITAPVTRCFDLSRSIDLHMASTSWTGERAIAGVTAGLIGLGQEVTWSGRHFGFRFTHTSRITAFEFPTHFQDRMVRGMFRRFCHDHDFECGGIETVMRDVMEFEAPLGLLGKVAERLWLEPHMRSLLERRNRCIQQTAESEAWKDYLPGRTT